MTDFHTFDCAMCGEETHGNTRGDEGSMLCRDCHLDFIYARGESLEGMIESIGYSAIQSQEIAADMRALFAARGSQAALDAVCETIRKRDEARCARAASAYRESDFYTPDELGALEADALEAMGKAREARTETTRRAAREERICKSFGWSLLASLGASLLNAVAPASLCAARLLAVSALASAVMAAVFLVRFTRAEVARMDAERAHRAAYKEWHRAFYRASCERLAAQTGTRGRCGCEDCEADPLGFFGPYRKGTAS